jgi:hypothetical protein
MTDKTWTPVLDNAGQPILTKKFSYTISVIAFGEESAKHIAAEKQATINGAPIRPKDWDEPGTQGYAEWRELLKARQALQFNPQYHVFGYARVIQPQGAGISAWIPDQQAATQPTQMGPAVNTARAVAATFGGVQPVIGQPAATGFNVNPGGFVVPAGV